MMRVKFSRFWMPGGGLDGPVGKEGKGKWMELFSFPGF